MPRSYGGSPASRGWRTPGSRGPPHWAGTRPATVAQGNSHARTCRVGFFMCSCCGNRAFTFDAYGDTMFRYVVVRLWLADRPDRSVNRHQDRGTRRRSGRHRHPRARWSPSCGRFTVELPDGYSPEALANALSELSGVEVEDLRHRVRGALCRSRPARCSCASRRARGPTELSSVLARGVCTAFTCDWCTVLDVSDARAVVLAEEGDAPSAAWLGAFAAGARAGLSLSPGGGAGLVGPRDVAWSPLDSSGLVVVAGRDGPPFRSRERRQLQQLCRVADARWSELVRTGARTPLSGAGQSRNQRLAAS